jgi:predicted nucleotidyltransferase
MRQSVPRPDEVLEVAAKVLAVRYPDADAAFVAGSLMRGEGSTTSDIDLVVLYGSLARAYRESLLFEEIPVETFVLDWNADGGSFDWAQAESWTRIQADGSANLR